MDSYKVFLDKPVVFECKLELEGAEMNNASVRLIAETSKNNMMFKGKIDRSGNCSINIPKMKGLLEQSDIGELTLEVIVDDSYFSPWQKSFIVETSKKLTVEVKENTTTQQKPVMRVAVKETKAPAPSKIDMIVSELKSKRITTDNILRPTNKTLLYGLIERHMGKMKPDSNIISEIVHKLKD